MRAISAFSFEAGTSSFWWRARIAFRMRARKSATGSVRLIPSPSSPVRSTYPVENLRGCFLARGPDTFIVQKPYVLHAVRGLHSSWNLPAGLHHAGNLAPVSQAAEAQAA